MKWISVKDKTPETNTPNSAQDYPVLVYSPERPGVYCVAYLEADHDLSLDQIELTWKLYTPGECAGLIERSLETFTHWMPLPNPPIQ